MKRGEVRYVPPSREKMLGSLPVVADFCRRLDIAGTVDRACPVRDVAIATHGQVIEALVANRLTSPTPLVHVEDWARTWAVEEVLGLAPEVLNDDRVGRALDAVAPELDGIIGSVGLSAIVNFRRLDTERLTSSSAFGKRMVQIPALPALPALPWVDFRDRTRPCRAEGPHCGTKGPGWGAAVRPRAAGPTGPRLGVPGVCRSAPKRLVRWSRAGHRRPSRWLPGPPRPAPPRRGPVWPLASSPRRPAGPPGRTGRGLAPFLAPSVKATLMGGPPSSQP